jgi:hydroxymethylglutaryl-CoA reductase (NADPH)
VVKGEHAKGEFYVPLATTEGTLVASYSRGMKVLAASGGVTTTIMDDAMQRAPVFYFEDARQVRDFSTWVEDHFDEIKQAADASTRFGRLRNIEHYPAAKFLFLRFNYTTGDAAGQNMVGKATQAACDWITKVHPFANFYVLESQFATDKKSSQINILNTRGKRVIAEATIPDAVMREELRSSPFKQMYGLMVSNIGTFMSGATSNGNHCANALAALFIATGQDAANIAEAAVSILHTERKKDGDLYISLTLPSLIVATYGGGTGLSTQRECLEAMGCYGQGKVSKFAEICAATALAGELSLSGAVGAREWVSSHDQLGRNRP